MKIRTTIFSLIFVFAFTALTAVNVYAGFPINETDTIDEVLVGAFDLRDRESFIQITNTLSSIDTIHVQIFNVGELCNENNFFDAYTGNDTHVYNLRDIVTNDGNPSGVVLPQDAYGIFVVTFIDGDGIGNLRIEDANGYEYRTNLNGVEFANFGPEPDVHTFNFNSESGVVFSDIFGMLVSNIGDEEVRIEPIADGITYDVDVYNLNEVPFSCRNVHFACTDQNSPLLEEILEIGETSVASFEYGINETIPSTKGAPLLCPNNVISNGMVTLTDLGHGGSSPYAVVVYVGLNNGNGRGSMDSVWHNNDLTQN